MRKKEIVFKILWSIVVNPCIINVMQFLTIFIMNMNQPLSKAKSVIKQKVIASHTFQ